MSRTVILAIVLAGSAGVAAGDPAPAGATEPPPCGVHIDRAPAEIGAAIERRLVALSACSGRLDVWVVRSEDGLYVIARDELGRVRERVVPDVEVAAALIASWVEIDAQAPLIGAGALAPPPSPATTAAQSPSPSPSRVAQVDDLPPSRPPFTDVGEHVVPPDTGDGAAMSPTMGLTAFAGVTIGGMTTAGAVIDRDLVTHDGVAIAAMAIVTRDIASSYYIVHWDDDFFRETGRWGGAAMLEIHRRFGTGLIRVSPSIAFGFGVTRHEVLVAPDAPAGEIAMTELRSEVTYGPRIAATLAVGIKVAPSIDLELTGGWMFTAYQSGGDGVDPSDQSLVGGLGLRYTR